MEKKIFEILEKMKLEVITLDEAQKQLCVLFGVTCCSQPKKEWVCNECNMPNFTTSVSEEEIEQELYSCINCGGFEFHLENCR